MKKISLFPTFQRSILRMLRRPPKLRVLQLPPLSHPNQLLLLSKKSQSLSSRKSKRPQLNQLSRHLPQSPKSLRRRRRPSQSPLQQSLTTSTTKRLKIRSPP